MVVVYELTLTQRKVDDFIRQLFKLNEAGAKHRVNAFH